MIVVFVVAVVLAFLGTLLSVVHYIANYKNCYSVGQKVYNTFLLVCMLAQIVFLLYLGYTAIGTISEVLAEL